MIHFKCRNSVYPDFAAEIKRQEVPDDKAKWEVEWLAYNPRDYTSSNIRGKQWADPDISNDFEPLWNSIDGNVNRVSYRGDYRVNDGRPVNPIGRTGLQGRGILGRWGPNHAADPIVTRWKFTDESKAYDDETGKPILQFVAIKRRDSGEWALPGGMIDAGEQVNVTLKREFTEEALNFLDKTEAEKLILLKQIDETFNKGTEVYKGYVDDPRNTDNAWMETVAVHFHDNDNTSLGALTLHAGDDAIGVRWMDINRDLKLYANHYNFVEKAVANVHAHW